MLTTLYSIGTSALSNAQVSVSNAANNIANSDTVGYKQTSTVYDSSIYINQGSLSVGTGATITEIQAAVDWFVEEQYLDATSALSEQNALYEYLAQAEALLNQEEDSGLSEVLSDFWSSWNAVAEDPASEAVREELLGNAELLVYELNNAASELDEQVDAINDELREQVADANQLIEDIATLNAAIVADQDNYDLINARDQAIVDLSEIIEISVTEADDGQVTITTCGYSLVEGDSFNELVYSSPNSDYSAVSGSSWEGDVNFSGTSSEEILLEFVSSGADGTAQFKVSLDGGDTWLADDSGNTLLYTADDSDGSVTIEGVEIWFDGTGDHAVGDRVTVMAKTGVYWTPNEGDSLYNLTTLTDDSGTDVGNRLESGSIAGLLAARDDELMELLDELDELASAIIWETNAIHSTGAGLEHHTSLSGTYSVDDSTAALSDSGLTYADNVEAGTISFTVYDASDDSVASNVSITFDPATDSLDDLALSINTNSGGLLTATVEADGTLSLASSTGMEFEIAGDDTGALAALGINTFFTGSDAEDIAINSYVLTDTAHVNCQVVESDGSVASGSNETAQALAELATEDVTVGDTTGSMESFLSAMLAELGTATATTELQQTYAASSLSYYEEVRESISGVNVDEETIDLTKYQQQYQAAAQIIAVAQEMFDTVLGIF